ncbi:hypothetical protein [Streptomyces sp. NPDC000410]|uniref:hypothetical protein n=1 Tax=Streptomyces sp. NPDC000410 TaxID=3154254 RepID=UPI00331FA56F
MRTAKIAWFGLAVLFISGCSGESEYDYAVPSEVCRVNIPASEIKPLLRPGKVIKETFREIGLRSGEHHSCDLVVDKKQDVSISVSRQTGELDIAEKAADKYVNLNRVSVSSGVTSAAVGDDGAVAWMKCKPKAGQPQYEFPEAKQGEYSHLALEVRTESESDGVKNSGQRRAEIESFLRAYVPALMKDWCS